MVKYLERCNRLLLGNSIGIRIWRVTWRQSSEKHKFVKREAHKPPYYEKPSKDASNARNNSFIDIFHWRISEETVQPIFKMKENLKKKKAHTSINFGCNKPRTKVKQKRQQQTMSWQAQCDNKKINCNFVNIFMKEWYCGKIPWELLPINVGRFIVNQKIVRAIEDKAHNGQALSTQY